MFDYCIYKLFINNNAYNLAGGLLVSTSSVLLFSTTNAAFKNAKLKLYIYINSILFIIVFPTLLMKLFFLRERQILHPEICLSLLSWHF